MRETGEVADGAVVGSAIIREIENNLDASGCAKPELLDRVTGLVSDLAGGLRS